jgi:hypothetical protein
MVAEPVPPEAPGAVVMSAVMVMFVDTGVAVVVAFVDAAVGVSVRLWSVFSAVFERGRFGADLGVFLPTTKPGEAETEYADE